MNIILDKHNDIQEVFPHIKFGDLFELKKIQQLQDMFADTFGLASIITEPDGKPITNPSNFTRLCADIIRKTEKGCANCFKSDELIGRYNPKAPIIQKCLSVGLWDAGASITVGGNHIANWLIGQVQNDDLDRQRLIRYGIKIGADEDAFMEALNEIPVMTTDQFRKIAKMLFIFANELSEKALVNLQLKQESIEREKVIEQLKESEERYRLIAENTADSIAVFDFNLNYTFLSPSVINLLGYTPEEMMTLRLENIVTPDSLEKVQQIFMEEMELERKGNADPNRNITVNTEQITKSSRNIWVESTVSMIRDNSGQPQNILAVSRDITDRIRNEKKLKESEKKYRTIFENVHDVFYKIDIDGTILEISPSIKYFSDFDRDEILNTDAKELYYDMNERDVFLQSLLKKGELHDYELSLKTKSGKRKYTSINARLVSDDNNKPNLIIGAIRDITKRKLAEGELYETNKRLINIFNNMPILLNAFDETNKIIFWNKACEESTGYAANEIIENLLAMEMLYPDAKYREIVWNSSQEPSIQENTYDLVSKSGGIRTIEWFDIHHKIKIPGWTSWGFGIDITERQKAVKELIKAKEDAEDSEQRLFSFVNSIPDIVCYKNEKGSWLLANNADLELFCLTGVDYRGKTDLELAEFTNEIYKNAFINCTKTDEIAWNKKTISKGIEKIPTKNGETKVYEVYKIPTFNSDGSRKRLAVIGRDISCLFETQENLKSAIKNIEERESRLKLATSSGKLGIWDWNIVDNKMIWDTRMFELYGISEKNFTHNIDSWVNNLHPEDKQIAIDEFAAALEGKTDFNTTFRVVHPNGKILYLRANGLIIRNIDGKPIRRIGINSNITKRKLAEQELIIAKTKAEESDLLKSSFIANMSHEIRTPLNGIIGFSELLNEPDFNQQQKSEFTKTIIEQSNNLMVIINDILEISIMDTKQLKIRNEKILVHELICDLKNEFSLAAGKKGLDIEICIPHTTIEPIIEIDKYRIRQIFNNLISNALKFTQKGFIEIGYSQKDNLIEFYVKDTGIGISEKYFQVIFERFRQVDNTNSRKYGGNGLGLAITENLLEILGGRIWVKSEVNKGSTFYFTLPIK